MKKKWRTYINQLWFESKLNEVKLSMGFSTKGKIGYSGSWGGGIN
jgi:hypothetical protein